MVSMERNYFVFLLRIWKSGDGAREDVRVILEDPRTHATVSFSRLDDLCNYLAEIESYPAQNINPKSEEI